VWYELEHTGSDFRTFKTRVSGLVMCRRHTCCTADSSEWLPLAVRLSVAELRRVWETPRTALVSPVAVPAILQILACHGDPARSVSSRACRFGIRMFALPGHHVSIADAYLTSKRTLAQLQ
jgi:hypothetical protein